MLWHGQTLEIIVIVFYIPNVKENFRKNKKVLSVYYRNLILSSPLTQLNTA
jgi:hypothetical protein